MEFEKPPKKRKKAGSQGPVKNGERSNLINWRGATHARQKPTTEFFLAFFLAQKQTKPKNGWIVSGGPKKLGNF